MASVVSVGSASNAPSSQWARKYPPLVALVAALVLAIVVLPSSLNLPQTNPSTTLEYAPVPPSDKDNPPPGGNFNGLGLASTSGLTQGGAPGGDQAAGDGLPSNSDLGAGVGHTPRDKPCVGTRQTADPLSPSCVTSWAGRDNFGATYQGVTREEVRIVIYVQGNYQYLNTAKGTEVTPNNQYDDLSLPESDNDFAETRELKVWARYFNDHYQSYNRYVHIWAYYSGNDDSPEERKAEAADNYARIRPFAIISYAEKNGDSYIEYMASKGVLNFGSYSFRPASFFQRYPKLIWGFLPSLEQQAALYTSYICAKMINKPVAYSGNTDQTGNGNPRKFGLLWASDPGRPELAKLHDLVKAQVEACGGKGIWADDKSFPGGTYDYDLSHLPNYAVANMAAFQSEHITTIIWPGGVDTNQTKAAGKTNYFPEWLLLGDGQMDQNTRGQNQDQTVWDHAAVISNITYVVSNVRDRICYKAYKDTAPDSPNPDAQQGCIFYNDLRQLFTGIQVAGPRLGPTSVDKGFHAIDKVPSTDATIPGCFYETNDYTCVKDGVLEHWDSTGKSPANNQPGCWRMAEVDASLKHSGRHIHDAWPAGNASEEGPKWSNTADVCNSYSVTTFTENPPDPNNPPTP